MNPAKVFPLALACTALLLGGCASRGNPKDPLEGFNRAVFSVNEGLDKVVIKPVAQGYDFVVPLPGKTIVSNFFSNLSDPWIAVNNLLQAKPMEALSDAGRFLINSTVGIGGAFDIASEIGLEKHEEDLGQTFGRWGVGDGPYIVLPLFGGRTTRDAVGLIGDSFADPVSYLDDVSTRNVLTGTRLISTRAALLPADKTVEEAALDKYSYLRDAYLQRRRNLIYDGNPPRVKDDTGALPGVAPAAWARDPVRMLGTPVLLDAPAINETAPTRVKGVGSGAGLAVAQ